MNPKNTWLWLTVAAGLFAFIFFFERHVKKAETGPPKVLPNLDAKTIGSVQIQPRGQLAIRVERTNGTWRITEPIDYPAQSVRVEGLLAALGIITGSPYLSLQDLKSIPDADEQFGFDAPQFSVMLGHKKYHLLIGNRTPPGDQVYVEVVGQEGVFVVDADLLKLVPQTANDWRETALIDWNQIGFNHLIVTNAEKVLELQLAGTNGSWRMISPMEARADSGKVIQSLKGFQNLRVQQFVTDDPKADLDSFGLQTPELSLVFLRNTNSLLRLDFGKSPTNNPALAYARRADDNAVVTVPRAAYESWSFSQSHDFRDYLDPHLLAFTSVPDVIEVHGDDTFTLQRDAENHWRVGPPQNFPADSNTVAQVLVNLTNLQATATQIEKEIVPPAELPKYGLATPFRQYTAKITRPDEATGAITNLTLGQLDFGTNQDKLFARVPGERSSVYSLPVDTLNMFPSASWQMRDHRIWDVSEADVASVTVQQGTRTRQYIRLGTKSWSLGPGTQVPLDEIVSAQIEETVHRLGDLSAAFWVQRGDQNSERFGIHDSAFQVTLELKDGKKLNIAFGKDAPSHFPYASVMLDGEPWIFEFPWTTYQFVQLYLTIPATSH